jgi:ABC-type bacteriocin/lantibiotic exporter with double-glycine peptidase domain
MKRPILGAPGLAFALAAVSAAASGAGLWLNVPFVPQSKDGCGAACISMVMRYWQKESGAAATSAADPQRILRDLYSAPAHGIYASDMKRYFCEHGFTTYVFKGNWDDLAHSLSKGRPLIVCLRPGGRASPLHYVVVTGLDPEENVVMVNDPARRKLLKLNGPSFRKSWKATGNWTLLALPQ